MLVEIQSLMAPDNPWKEQVQFFPTITSTNDVLKQMAQQGAPQGTTLIANQQTGGRGRLGRSFLSPSDVGIYMSVLLRPQCRPNALMHLTCAAAVGACDAIENAAGIRPGIKWTNDIVCQKRKLAGILTEMSLTQSGYVDYAIIGIGINCCQVLEDFPTEIRDFAGSLSMVTGEKISRAKVAASMTDAFARMEKKLLSRKEEILGQYRKDCITIGQQVSVLRGSSVRYGTAIDVDEEGALVVAFQDGTTEAVNSGEVSVRGMYHYV